MKVPIEAHDRERMEEIMYRSLIEEEQGQKPLNQQNYNYLNEYIANLRRGKHKKRY